MALKEVLLWFLPKGCLPFHYLYSIASIWSTLHAEGDIEPAPALHHFALATTLHLNLLHDLFFEVDTPDCLDGLAY